jgi:3-phosphoshikimate 1-carboxyvinyltransferase
VPVIAIDGPTASGKGTLAAEVAAQPSATTCSTRARCTAPPGWRCWPTVDADDEAAVARIAGRLDLRFEGGRTLLRGRDVTEALREEPPA